MFLNHITCFTLRIRGDVKRLLEDYQGALKELDKVNVLEPHNVFTLGIHGNVKRLLEDYQRALEDLDKVDVLELNNAIILKSCGNVKMLLEDYQGALHDFDNVNGFEPNNVLILQVVKISKCCWRTIKERCKTSIMLIFLTKQCVHFVKAWRCQKVVEGLSKSIE